MNKPECGSTCCGCSLVLWWMAVIRKIGQIDRDTRTHGLPVASFAESRCLTIGLRTSCETLGLSASVLCRENKEKKTNEQQSAVHREAGPSAHSGGERG